MSFSCGHKPLMGVKCVECAPGIDWGWHMGWSMTDREQEDFERRLAGLEKCASDAIGSAHKCITSALASMDERISKLEEKLNHEPDEPNV